MDDSIFIQLAFYIIGFFTIIKIFILELEEIIEKINKFKEKLSMM